MKNVSKPTIYNILHQMLLIIASYIKDIYKVEYIAEE